MTAQPLATAPIHAATPNDRSPRQLVGCLLLILLAAWLASLIQSDGGAVQVTGLRIPTQGGQWLAADLFRPRTATKAAPAPLVVVVPGFQRSKEALSNVSIELARRGVVVIAIDPYAQGNSRGSAATTLRGARTAAACPAAHGSHGAGRW